jgi:hypothetical protein
VDLAMPLWIVVAALVAVAVVVGQHRAAGRRRRGFQLAAVQLGLAYTPEDPFGLLDLPFELLGRGDGRGIENLLYGSWNGMPVHVFDYWYYEETSNGKTTSRTYSRFDVVVTAIDASCPHLTIAEENVLTRLADALALDDLQFESEAFNRAFNVKGDHAFGVAFCDARMMDWLLARGGGHIFEAHGSRLLVACDRLDPTELSHLLQAARDWISQIPRVVFSLYAQGG